MCIFALIINQTKFKMKKLMYLFVAGTMFAFTACGGGETATEATAVEEVVVEEVAVEEVVEDTTAVVEDTTAVAEEAEATEEVAE